MEWLTGTVLEAIGRDKGNSRAWMGQATDCSSQAVAQCLFWSHRICRNVNTVYRKPLSKQKPGAPAHSFGFSPDN